MIRSLGWTGADPWNSDTRQHRSSLPEWSRRAAVAITAGTTIAENQSASARQSSESVLQTRHDQNREALTRGPMAVADEARAEITRSRIMVEAAAAGDANSQSYLKTPNRSSGFGVF